jgi:hypothetical protein
MKLRQNRHSPSPWWPPALRRRYRPAVQRRPRSSSCPLLVYRTGPYAPNGIPMANGKQDYLKAGQRRGGINGVKIASKNARPATTPPAAWNATSA